MTPTQNQRIPAKILLFGEHTILRGSNALAMPLWSRGCEWQQGGTTAQQGGLPGFLDYLSTHLPSHYALQQLEQDLAAGWYLASDIPIGYGLGSSAALCVAVFERYATKAGKMALVAQGAKAYFAQLERYFHGTSSGTDPLIIYERKIVALSADKIIDYIRIPKLPDHWHFFLLDTGKARETAPLVNYFTERYDTDARFRNATDQQWSPAVNSAIEALKDGTVEKLHTAFRDISQFQLNELPPMVLPSLRDIWQTGLDGDSFLLKICGAGGGGYCLGLTSNWDVTQSILSSWSLEQVHW